MEKQLKYMQDKHPDILKNEPPHLVLRFNTEWRLNYEEPIEKQLEKLQFKGWDNLKKKYTDASLRPLFTALKPEVIRALVERASKTDSTYKPASFFSYFRLDHPDAYTLLTLIKEVRRWAGIENVAMYVPAPDPAVSPADDPRSVNQGYLDAAPQGIDARYAWGFTGGDGAGLSLVDMERGWTFNHEDLTAHGITLIHGTLLNSSRSHGTAVLGEICSVDNSLGCVGIVPHLTSVMASSYNGSTQANAILAAIGSLSFGDVLLLEAQNWVPEISMMLGPIEITDDSYDAIRLATALGIVVVEAGGNGTNNGSTPPFNLDTYVNGAGNAILTPGAPGFRDSGAIIVTAASSAAPHTRLAYGPHGARIDNYAWGHNINTLNSDSAGATTLYQTGFGGTSGASPIITGAALAVQGIAQANLGFRFSPKRLRAILRNPATGTPRSVAETTIISVMPNLRLIIDNVLNVAPDVYLRDFVGDVGDAHTGAISASPDVIVQNATVANPQASFGQGSGTENNASLGHTVQGGVDNYIYVRALNRGGMSVNNVDATVYWSPVASLVTPDLWTLVGNGLIPAVPSGNQLSVSNAITWPSAAIPGPGHYCFVALLGHALDPAPSLADFMNWDNFRLYIRNNNNVTWRNFNVEPAAPSPDADPQDFAALPFLLVGAPDKLRPFDIRIVGKLPQGSRLMFEMPMDLYKRSKQYFPELEVIDKLGIVRAFLNPFQATLLKSLRLPAKYRAQCRLLVAIPKELHEKRYRLQLSQFYKNLQVGGITWEIGGKK